MNERIDRRHFLGAAGTAAAGLALYDPVFAAAAKRSRHPAARNVAFGQGVASGEPGLNGIMLWTRVDNLERKARVKLEVARDPGFRRVVYRTEMVAEPRLNFSLKKRINNRRILKPGREYYYRFAGLDDSGDAVGRFRTARPADSREPVRIGFFSCQQFEEGYYTAHAGLAAEDLDLVICLGDYIYERNDADGGGSVRRDRTGGDDREVRTLAEYRDKYALYHSDANLRAVRAKYPILSIWDDHEVENDYAGEIEETGDPEDFPGRRRAAYRAFFEAMPYRPPAGSTRIYGRVPVGANAEVFLLDERQYRSKQPCGGEAGPCPPEERDNPNQTMLGPGQREWFKSALADSRATWKVCANQVMIMALDAPARSPINPDQWDGYGYERGEIMEHIRTRGIKDVTFITGDIHTYYAGVVTKSGRRGVDSVDGPPVATEFVGGSITSSGLAANEADAQTLESGVASNNPHIVYNEQLAKGYAVLEARPDELLVKFRGVRSIREPESEVFTLQEFRVPSGTADVEVRGGG